MNERTREENLQMFNDNINLAYYIAIKNSNRFWCRGWIDENDLTQHCLIMLWRCVQEYDESRGIPFSNYFSHILLLSIRTFFRDTVARQAQNLISIDKIAQAEKDGDEECFTAIPAPDDTEQSALNNIGLEKALSALPTDLRFYIEMTIYGYNTREIGEMLGITRDGAYKRLKVAVARVKPLLEVG